MSPPEHRGPWTRHYTETLLALPRCSIHVDHVTTPGGGTGEYPWIYAPSLVRIAALTTTGGIYITRQFHYLPGKIMAQLPGGAIDEAETPLQAAKRELQEETGASAASWTELGSVWPMPGLVTARVWLFIAEQLTTGTANPEPSEADLTARLVPLEYAVQAALDGSMACAASAQLTLAVAMRQRT